jgi:hypothetical protein
VITALLGAPRTLPAQLLRVDHFKPNAIYFELGGAGGTYSINYDYRPRERVVLRAGATSWDFTNLDNRREKLSAVIVGAGGLAPWPIGRYRRGDWIEWGALLMGGSHFHATYGTVDGSGAFVSLVPYAGVRHQQDHGTWMYHVAVTPQLPIVGGDASWPSRSAEMSATVGVGFIF